MNVFTLKYIFNTVKLLILILLLFSKTSFASDLTQLFSNLKNASDHEIAMKYEKKFGTIGIMMALTKRIMQ